MMKNTSAMTVVVSAQHFNDLRQILDAIARQTVQPHRLIVVHAETDTECSNTINQWASEKNLAFEIDLVATHQSTVGAARNASLYRINIDLYHIDECKFVYFTDPYYLPPPDFFEKATKALSDDPSLAAAHPNYIIFQDNTNTPLIDLSVLPNNPWLWLMQCRYPIAGMIMLRTSALRKAGWFNPLLPLGYDIDLYIRVANQGAWCCMTDYSMPQVQQSTEAEQHSDHLRQWVLVCERMLDDYMARNHIARRTYLSLLSKLWYQAGLDLLACQSFEEARDCFTRSLSWRIINPSVLKLYQLKKLTKQNAL